MTVNDAQTVLMAYTEGLASGTVNLSEEAAAAADVDRDSEITAADAQYILIYFVLNNVTGTPTAWEDIIKKT